MKLLFSLLLVTAIQAGQCREIILVENLASSDEGKMLLSIIEEKFNIPKSMVTYKAQKECSINSEAIMHLCLRQNGELDVLRVNRFVVKNSLSTFYDDNSKNYAGEK